MAFNPTKCDPELGLEIHKMLVAKGLETPMVIEQIKADPKAKIETITELFTQIMETLGLDLTNDSLIDTPRRIAKMYVNEIFWGLNPAHFPKVASVANGLHYDEMVIEENISVLSQCEHHFVTIDGFATVAYIPDKHVIGLSKMNRIVEYFSRRPQIQERLVAQVHAAICHIVGHENVAVHINARHYCVKQRGVEDHNSSTTTTKLSGVFRDTSQRAREEFLSLTRRVAS